MTRLRLTVSATALAALTAVSAQAQTTIRYAEYGPDRGVRAEAIKYFAEQIAERSNGSITLDITWGGALVSGRDVMRSVESGFVDAGTFVPSWEPNMLHLYEVGDLPMGSADPWVAMRAMYDTATTNEALINEFAEHNAVYLMQFNTGPVQLICREPIDEVSDFEGKRIRAVGPYIEAFTSLGAEIVSFPAIEVYQALDSGLMDCSQVYWSNVTAYRLHEVASHLVQMDFGQMLGLVGVMNLGLWEDLSAEEQQLMREVGRDTTDFLANALMSLGDEVKAQMEAGIDGHMVSVATPPAEVMEVVTSRADDLTAHWLEATAAKGLAGQDVLDQFLAAQTDLAAVRDANGYPWN
ncbi:C4-dicarboxylate TRAP transporter substrate-binding protein [Roseibaca sp. Y0-43]|uniref:C4-dicarboxylate TRAP transporter substrate-binding protein n=1 Tax=Roseibaca sp. Y0-43 TaxID=2816854 RepID=UPI001D0CA931|nr:C4-dicarboxylate TRAP transporter substrate-binding protein [Roseibaca sp. Y0-43]MCC1482295.1 C4-dicarboxylate TRAP transporter substrate-binding protein [Roseibaca sp. Y0-43]